MSLRAQNRTVSNPYLPTDSNFLVTPPEPRLIDLVSPTAVYFIVTTLLVSSVLVPSIGFLSSTLNFIVLSLSNSSWSFVFEFLLPFLACVFAALVFLVRNPMHALLSLVGVFFSTVLFYVGAGIEFIGLVFLIVYVGAVAVLFLFVIMLLNVKSLTSSERLIRHASQVIAIAAGIILFCQLKIRVIGAASVALLQSHAASPSISSTAADAVIFYVRYRASDINALTPLYTQHSPLFMIITIILLVALLGAIIMATITTEKPTVVADICVAPVTDARLTFQRLSAPKFTAAVAMFALCFTAAHDDLLPCAAFIFGWFKKRTPVRVTMQSPRVRAWVRKYKLKSARTWAFKGAEGFPIMWRWKKSKHVNLNRMVHSPRSRDAYYTLRRMGLLRYIRFDYNTHAIPRLHWRATMANLYAPIFFVRLVLILAICVPVPWFLDDYDVAWRDLVSLYSTIWTTINDNVWLQPYAYDLQPPKLLVHVLTVLLLYPCAMVRVALVDFWPVMLITFFYVKDEYGHNHGRMSWFYRPRFAHQLLREPGLAAVKADVKIFMEKRQKLLEQHPDKGRTDFSWLFALWVGGDELQQWFAGAEPGTIGTYRFDFVLKILRYEYAYWPENLSLLGFVLIALAVVYSGSSLVLVYTNRKLHKTRIVPTLPWRKIILSLLAFIVSLTTLSIYSAVVLEDFFDLMGYIHSPENVLRATGGRTSSNIPYVVVILLLIIFWKVLGRFTDKQYNLDMRMNGLLRRHLAKRSVNDLLWRSRLTYLERYRGVGVNYALHLEDEDEERPLVSNSPKDYENHEGPYEVRVRKYKKGGFPSARPRFDLLKEDERVYAAALAEILYDPEDRD